MMTGVQRAFKQKGKISSLQQQQQQQQQQAAQEQQKLYR
jgi:hypothetical protein